MPTNRRNVTSEDLKNEVLAKIKQYEDNGFQEASKIHGIIMESNPRLCPRLWYGMPGYAKTKDSAVLCFFRKDTLISFGITESAKLTRNESISPSSWYIHEIDEDAEAKIREVVTEATR
jgi:hypothetical protein